MPNFVRTNTHTYIHRHRELICHKIPTIQQYFWVQMNIETRTWF